MKWIILAAALLGGTSTVMGAMGAHVQGLGDASRQSWQTAVTFGLLHAVAAIGVIAASDRLRWPVIPATGLVLGGWVFAGAIWLKYLAATGGALAPVGGMILIAGWVSLAISALVSGRKA